MPAIPTLRRERQEDSGRFQVSQNYKMKPILKSERGGEGRERERETLNSEGCGDGSVGKLLYETTNLTSDLSSHVKTEWDSLHM